MLDLSVTLLQTLFFAYFRPGILCTPVSDVPMASFNLFGRRPPKKAAAKPKSMAETMGTLDSAIKNTTKRADHLENKIREQLIMAKTKGKAGDKRGALLCLKRKKMYEAEVAKLRTMSLNLEQQKFALESSATTAMAMEGMRTTASALKAQALDTDVVEEVMEDLNEQMQNGQEVQDLLGTAIGGDTVDDDEVLGELDDLEAEVMEEEMMSGVNAKEQIAQEPVPQVMPEVPTAVPTAEMAEEEAALAQLEAEMGM